MLFFTLFSFLFALPPAQHTEYLRRISAPQRPTILVLISPGWDEIMLSPLLQHLWKEGFSVWSLKFSPHAQDIDSMNESIKKAIAVHQSPFIVAQGLSSVVLVQNLQSYNRDISGVGFLGAPIQPFCSPKLIESLKTNRWNHFQSLPLIQANDTFHTLIHNWCTQEETQKTTLISNIWAATTNVHPLAPPESVRPYLHKEHRFLRSGPLALHGKEPTFLELPIHQPTLSDLTAWLWKHKPWIQP